MKTISEKKANNVSFSPQTICYTDTENAVFLMDFNYKEVQLQHACNHKRTLKHHPNDLILITSDACAISTWDITKQVKTSVYNIESPKTMNFNEHGILCVATHDDIQFIDLRKKIPIKRFRIHDVNIIEWNKNELYVANYEGIYNFEYPRMNRIFFAQENLIADIKFRECLFFTKREQKNTLSRVKNSIKATVDVLGFKINIFKNFIAIGGENKIEYDFENKKQRVKLANTGIIKDFFEIPKQNKLLIFGSSGILEVVEPIKTPE